MQNKRHQTLHPLEIALSKALAQFFQLNKHYSQAPSNPKTHKTKPNFLLGLSGGLDSVVLLHALCQLRKTHDFELAALHVHHGLNSQADAWAQFCLDVCAQYQIHCQVQKVEVQLKSGLGVEASARLARYQALFNTHMSLQNNDQAVLPDYIFTAHHQDDQAETLLFKLARGTGVKGLAGIARVDEAKRLCRPLLDVSRDLIHEYAVLNQLSWCEDDSNQSSAFDRNYIRHSVLPILNARFPAMRSALLRTADHMTEANVLLSELAAMDANHCLINNKVNVEALSALSHARAKNFLRWWFNAHQVMMPTLEHLESLLTQCLQAKADANIEVVLKTHHTEEGLLLKRYQGHLSLVKPVALQDYDVVWNGEDILNLPDGSRLIFTKALGVGIALKLAIQRLRITNKKHGERFKPEANRPTRTLKHLLQEANMPPWQRVHLPLIYWDDTLVCVPGVGVAFDLKPAPDALGLVIDWQDGAR